MAKLAKKYDVTCCGTTDEVLTVSRLNWEPELRRASYMGEQGDGHSCNHWAVVNPTRPASQALAYVGNRFRPNSHVIAAKQLEPLLRSGTITPHNVSVWDGGLSVAMQFRCAGISVEVGPRSIVSPLLTLSINHDGKATDRSFFADFDFWCHNQAGLVAKVGGEGIRHSDLVISKYSEQLERKIDELSQGLSLRYATMVRMSETKLAPSCTKFYFQNVMQLPLDDDRNRVLSAVTKDYDADDHGVPGTVWHAYSAITRYTTHSEGVSDSVRLERAMLGAQSRFDRAFNEAALLTMQ